jgi:hypothetical protein
MNVPLGTRVTTPSGEQGEVIEALGRGGSAPYRVKYPDGREFVWTPPPDFVVEDPPGPESVPV